MKFIGLGLRTKEGDILLTERQVHRRQGIQSGSLAWIDLDQSNGRDRFGEGLALSLTPGALALLFHLSLLPWNGFIDSHCPANRVAANSAAAPPITSARRAADACGVACS